MVLGKWEETIHSFTQIFLQLQARIAVPQPWADKFWNGIDVFPWSKTESIEYVPPAGVPAYKMRAESLYILSGHMVYF